MGLQLGKENVLHTNVSSWVAIKDCVKKIVIYACASADTEPGNRGTTADGQYLLGALAIHANADVYGADRIQWYSGATSGDVHFGKWEGQLWHFPASGAPANRVTAPPVDLFK
jgi:hypothetical protein